MWSSDHQLTMPCKGWTYQDNQSPTITSPDDIMIFTPSLQALFGSHSYSLSHRRLPHQLYPFTSMNELTRTSHTASVSFVKETKKLPRLLGRIA
jgi:hypothetical protein